MARSNIKKSSDYIIKTFDVKGQYTALKGPLAGSGARVLPPPFILGIRGAPTIRIRAKSG